VFLTGINLAAHTRRRFPMNHIDGFVVPVPLANREAYRNAAEKGSRLFKEYGALSVANAGATTCPKASSPRSPWPCSARTRGRGVLLDQISWPSRAARDEGMKKAMADPRMEAMNPMPFDGKRMIFGGFEVIVDA
jgi:uncharacterized protein YbaA (DUF1428 family)